MRIPKITLLTAQQAVKLGRCPTYEQRDSTSHPIHGVYAHTSICV